MRRYRIGLMVGNKSIDYVQAIRMGVQNTLEEAGHDLIAISDLIPFHSRSNAKAYFRVAFEVASRLNLDAIIVPVGIISGYLTNEQDALEEFLGILDSKKTLVIERKVDGYRSIGKDNAAGMHECMRHLIETCGFTKIAFLGGPRSSKGALERENIYYQEMEDHGLTVTRRMVEYGEYSGECGDSIDKLIDNNEGLQAIACCCDLEAHSVYNTMRYRNLAVGRDIAVTGFDDDALSAHLDPPLSTVHMTGYDLGRMAAREALRICEGIPQEEFVLSSSFVARGSCGESVSSAYEKFLLLFKQSPFPTDEVANVLMEPTLTMAPVNAFHDFQHSMCEFVDSCYRAYQHHKSANSLAADDELFSSKDLNNLFNKVYHERLSLEGFHSAAICALQALADVSSKEDNSWVIDQISHLHLGISRMLNIEVQQTRIAMSKREWTSFHITDDALRESTNPHSAYGLILDEFAQLGVRRAYIYHLPEPVAFIGSRTFALSDMLLPIGELVDGEAKVTEGLMPSSLQGILDNIIREDDPACVYTVGGVMAGNELVGIVAMDSGTLDDDGQLIAFLNLGIALKHLQMIATERESNELLSKSNLLLERQSHYDEMTGALNRRGFMDRVRSILANNKGKIGALFYLDLDGLKTINDTFGHDIGDEAIRNTTRVLEAFFPRGTIVGRLGGDEFVTFTLIDHERDIDALGHSVEAGMGTFNATHSYPFLLSISYGGVPIAIDDNSFTNITQSMVLADERLYKMKRTRKNARGR